MTIPTQASKSDNFFLRIMQVNGASTATRESGSMLSQGSYLQTFQKDCRELGKNNVLYVPDIQLDQAPDLAMQSKIEKSLKQVAVDDDRVQRIAGLLRTESLDNLQAQVGLTYAQLYRDTPMFTMGRSVTHAQRRLEKTGDVFCQIEGVITRVLGGNSQVDKVHVPYRAGVSYQPSLVIPVVRYDIQFHAIGIRNEPSGSPIPDDWNIVE